MEKESRRYYLRITNPKTGTYLLLEKLWQEFSLPVDCYWQKRDDPEITLRSRPVYSKNFNFVMLLYSYNLCIIRFIEYLIQSYINNIEKLENALNVSLNNKGVPEDVKSEDDSEILNGKY
jgi:hypothetical protein